SGATASIVVPRITTVATRADAPVPSTTRAPRITIAAGWAHRPTEKRKTAIRRTTSPSSVRHRIDHVVDPDPYAERRELLGISRIVRVLPGIAQVHVVADGHQQAAVI